MLYLFLFFTSSIYTFFLHKFSFYYSDLPFSAFKFFFLYLTSTLFVSLSIPSFLFISSPMRFFSLYFLHLPSSLFSTLFLFPPSSIHSFWIFPYSHFTLLFIVSYYILHFSPLFISFPSHSSRNFISLLIYFSLFLQCLVLLYSFFLIYSLILSFLLHNLTPIFLISSSSFNISPSPPSLFTYS